MKGNKSSVRSGRRRPPRKVTTGAPLSLHNSNNKHMPRNPDILRPGKRR